MACQGLRKHEPEQQGAVLGGMRSEASKEELAGGGALEGEAGGSTRQALRSTPSSRDTASISLNCGEPITQAGS